MDLCPLGSVIAIAYSHLPDLCMAYYYWWIQIHVLFDNTGMRLADC